MKIMNKYGIAVIAALLLTGNAMRLTDEDNEVQQAWNMIEQRRDMQKLEESKQAAEKAANLEEYRKNREWELDITNPAHNQGRKFEIADDAFMMSRGEPPSKNAGATEEPNMGEEEGKGKEMAEAAAASAAF